MCIRDSDYVDGADLVGNDNIETVVISGDARAYGIEFLLKKIQGRHKYWIAYTISKSEQKTPGRNRTETGINFSNWYNTPYDKTHDLSINSEYKINNKLKLVGNFIYQTGQPTNYPNSQYNYMNLNIPNYGERNSSRLPNYHRLDIGAVRHYNYKGYKIDLFIQVINAYWRDNPFNQRYIFGNSENGVDDDGDGVIDNESEDSPIKKELYGFPLLPTIGVKIDF